jgi:hypothetical protein
MPSSSLVALVRATPATVVDDYRRLLACCEPLLMPPFGPLAVLPAAPDALPGERAEPWQLDGMLAALAHRGRRPAVALPGTTSADPFVVVARSHGAQSVASAQPRFVLCGVGQVALLNSCAAPAATPALYVVDAVTTLGGSATTPQLDMRGVLLASDSPAALAAWIEQQACGRRSSTAFELVGDLSIAAERWNGLVARRKPLWHASLAERLLSFAGLGQPRTQQLYEEWLFYTGWGKLFRRYQRCAVEANAAG